MHIIYVNRVYVSLMKKTWNISYVDFGGIGLNRSTCGFWAVPNLISWTNRINTKKYYKELRREIININRRQEGRKVERKKANCTGHSLHSNCLLKHVIEGRIGVTGRRGRRRRKQILSNFKDTRGYWKLKEETLDCTLWRICFWSCYGSVVGRQSYENDFSEDHSKKVCLPPKTLVRQYCWRQKCEGRI